MHGGDPSCGPSHSIYGIGRVVSFHDVLEVYHIRRASGRKIHSKFLIPCRISPAYANKLGIRWALLLQKRETRSCVMYKAETGPNDITLREHEKMLETLNA